MSHKLLSNAQLLADIAELQREHDEYWKTTIDEDAATAKKKQRRENDAISGEKPVSRHIKASRTPEEDARKQGMRTTQQAIRRKAETLKKRFKAGELDAFYEKKKTYTPQRNFNRIRYETAIPEPIHSVATTIFEPKPREASTVLKPTSLQHNEPSPVQFQSQMSENEYRRIYHNNNGNIPRHFDIIQPMPHSPNELAAANSMLNFHHKTCGTGLGRANGQRIFRIRR